MRFIHTADIHLDSPLRGLEIHEDAPLDEIRGATRRAFDNLIDLAIEENVDFVLIAGDLYDGDWKDYNTGLFFVGRMGKLNKANIPVVIVSGNHDAASNTTKAMPLPENVTLLSARKPQSVKLDELGVLIHGQSYATKALTENIASSYPQGDPHYFNIGVLHTSLTGREEHESYAPCSIDDLRSKGYDYWALGHVHQREIVSEEPLIIFPGNLQGRHIKETGSKGATLVTVADGQITHVEHRELDVLRWSRCEVDLSACDTLDGVYREVRNGIEKELEEADSKTVALRLILTGQCPIHSQLLERTVQLTEELRGITAGFGDVWLEKVQFNTSRSLSLEEIMDEDSPLTSLVRSIEKLELDAEHLNQIVPELSILTNKLPPELLTGEDRFLDPSPANIAELRSEVQELLIAKLLKQGGHSA